MKKVSLFLLLSILLMFSACGKPEQTVNQITVELGDEVPTNADTYFNITEQQLAQLTIDVSNVDITQCGSYEMIFSYKENFYTVNVKIIDTIPPVLAENYSFEIECGEPFLLSDLNLEYTDQSQVSLKFADEELEKYKLQTESNTESRDNYLCLYTPGNYKLALSLEDAYGNSSTSTIELIAIDTTAPTFSGLDNLEIDYGSSINLLDGVTAVDTVDGNISGNISVTEIDTSISGEQICTYTVSDSSGNITEVQRTIIVKEKPTPKKPSSLARSTSLECIQIEVTHYIEGDYYNRWVQTYEPDVTLGEVDPDLRKWPEDGDTRYLLSDMWFTFTNGVDTVRLDMGNHCNCLEEFDSPFWDGFKIVARQTLSLDGHNMYMYLTDQGEIMEHTDTTRVSEYLSDTILDALVEYGYSPNNWIYY